MSWGVNHSRKAFWPPRTAFILGKKNYHLFFWRSPFGEMKTYSNSSQSFNSGVYSGLQVSVAFNTISWPNYLDDSGLSPWLRQPPEVQCGKLIINHPYDHHLNKIWVGFQHVSTIPMSWLKCWSGWWHLSNIYSAQANRQPQLSCNPPGNTPTCCSFVVHYRRRPRATHCPQAFWWHVPRGTSVPTCRGNLSGLSWKKMGKLDCFKGKSRRKPWFLPSNINTEDEGNIGEKIPS